MHKQKISPLPTNPFNPHLHPEILTPGQQKLTQKSPPLLPQPQNNNTKKEKKERHDFHQFASYVTCHCTPYKHCFLSISRPEKMRRWIKRGGGGGGKGQGRQTRSLFYPAPRHQPPKPKKQKKKKKEKRELLGPPFMKPSAPFLSFFFYILFSFSHYRACSSHPSHHLLTPNTAALPSSLPSR